MSATCVLKSYGTGNISLALFISKIGETSRSVEKKTKRKLITVDLLSVKEHSFYAAKIIPPGLAVHAEKAVIELEAKSAVCGETLQMM